MKTTVTAILVFLILLALSGVFYFGYTMYPRWHNMPYNPPQIVYVRDTVPYLIPDTMPWYHLVLDTTVYTDTNFVDIDTGKVLKDYFAWHKYTRTWRDSSLEVTLHDIVSQNKLGGNEFIYKILRPTEVITNTINSTTYKRYLYAGFETLFKDFHYTTVKALYAFPSGYIEGGYNFGLQGVVVGGGGNIWKMK